MRHSFRMPSHPIGFLRYWLSHYHLQSGLGVIVWHSGHLSLHDNTGVLLQYTWIWYFCTSFFSCVRGTRIVVTLDIVFEELHVSRVVYPDYPGCDRLRTVSKDELSSLFCETPSSWGDHKNSLCLGFATGSRFLNMVMIFILHLLSHYNSITEPRAWFLLSLLEDISIDFPFHFILSFIVVYRDTMTHDKLIFPLAITRILHHFSVSFPKSHHFMVMSAIDAAIVRRSEA